MSLIPSNPAVQEKLIQLREERARARELFRLAVLHESVRWEAELLLELEEFREKGGFAIVQDSIRREIRRKRMMDDSGRPEQVPSISENHIKHVQEVFLADKIDSSKAFACTHETTALHTVGDPTMATERAILRIEILKKVTREIRDALEAEQDEQDAKDRALVEEHRLTQQVLYNATRRTYGM